MLMITNWTIQVFDDGMMNVLPVNQVALIMRLGVPRVLIVREVATSRITVLSCALSACLDAIIQEQGQLGRTFTVGILFLSLQAKLELVMDGTRMPALTARQENIVYLDREIVQIAHRDVSSAMVSSSSRY